MLSRLRRARALFAAPPARGEDRERLRRIAGLLARPRLDPAQQERLRRWAERLPAPAPFPPGLVLLRPLFAEHLRAAGVPWEAAFPPENAPGPERLRAAGLAGLRRRGTLEAAARALADAGPVLAVKGAALAECFPAPGLRAMSDLDLAVLPGRRAEAEHALAAAGFLRGRGPASEIWIHEPTGGAIDLQVLAGARGRSLLDGAAPLPGAPGILAPDPSRHLVVVACHAAKHGGGRIWRDAADARALVEVLGADPAAARAFAEASGAEAELEALLGFLAWLEGRRIEDGLARHYRAIACESCPPMALSMASQGFDGLWRWPAALRRWPAALRRRGVGSDAAADSPPGQWTERDFGVGEAPPAGTLARQGFKLIVAAGLAASGRARDLARLAAAGRRAARDAPSFLRPARDEEA